MAHGRDPVLATRRKLKDRSGTPLAGRPALLPVKGATRAALREKGIAKGARKTRLEKGEDGTLCHLRLDRENVLRRTVAQANRQSEVNITNNWIQLRRDMNLRNFNKNHAVTSWLMVAVIVASSIVTLAMPVVVLVRALGLALMGFSLIEVVVGAIAARIVAKYAAQLCISIADQIARG